MNAASLVRTTWLGWLIPALLASCAPPPRPAGAGSSRVEGLRTEAEVAAALQRAEQAYLGGEWGVAVVEANRVLEGAATPDDYYAAVRILGLASCNRADLRPAAFAWKRLRPDDREHLRSVCAGRGVMLQAGSP